LCRLHGNLTCTSTAKRKLVSKMLSIPHG
jgi:hypothetical protein